MEDVVVLESFSNEEISEELAQIRIVGFIIESKRPRVVEENAELVRETTAEKISRSSHLLLHDLIILLPCSRSLETLPRKRIDDEVGSVCAGVDEAVVGQNDRVTRVGWLSAGARDVWSSVGC
jgi:hypothetical protein